MPQHKAPFEEWKVRYAHRVMLMAGVRAIKHVYEMIPHDDILRECWMADENPDELPMMEWDE